MNDNGFSSDADGSSVAASGFAGDAAKLRLVRPSLGSLLVEAGLASEQDVQLAVVEGMTSGERLGETVIRRGWIDEDGLGRLLAHQWNLPFLAGELSVDPQSPLRLEQALELQGCPVLTSSGNFVVVADPAEGRLTAIRTIGGADLSVAVVGKAKLVRLLDEYRQLVVGRGTAGPDTAVVERAAAGQRDETEALLDELERVAERALALRGRVERLVELEQETASAARASEEQLEALRERHESDRARLLALENELSAYRNVIADARSKLEAAVAALTQT